MNGKNPHRLEDLHYQLKFSTLCKSFRKDCCNCIFSFTVYVQLQIFEFITWIVLDLESVLQLLLHDVLHSLLSSDTQCSEWSFSLYYRNFVNLYIYLLGSSLMEKVALAQNSPILVWIAIVFVELECMSELYKTGMWAMRGVVWALFPFTYRWISPSRYHRTSPSKMRLWNLTLYSTHSGWPMTLYLSGEQVLQNSLPYICIAFEEGQDNLVFRLRNQFTYTNCLSFSFRTTLSPSILEMNNRTYTVFTARRLQSSKVVSLECGPSVDTLILISHNRLLKLLVHISPILCFNCATSKECSTQLLLPRA